MVDDLLTIFILSLACGLIYLSITIGPIIVIAIILWLVFRRMK